MVKTQTDLATEVDELIQDGVQAGQVMPANWIVQAIVERHRNISGPDVDFYTLCAFGHVRDTVRMCLRAYKGDSTETPEQLKLPGYEFLQKAYLIERDGEQQIVPLTECTSDELGIKISEYRRMAEGCIKHANELERYRYQHFNGSNEPTA